MELPESEQWPFVASGMHSELLFHDGRAAYERALRYLEAIGVEDEEGSDLARRATDAAFRTLSWDGADAFAVTLKELRRLIMERYSSGCPVSADPEDRFEQWLLERGRAGNAPRGFPAAGVLSWRNGAIRSTPPLARRSMVATKLERGLLRRIIVRAGKGYGGGFAGAENPARADRGVRANRRKAAWSRAARRRRLLLGALTLIPAAIASQFMAETLPYQGGNWLEVAIVVLFAALFGWISIGFWTAVAGFVLQLRGKARFSVAPDPGAGGRALDPAARIAIIMPICDEPVDRAFAGLRAVFRSLERSGAGRSFDFFVLSDSADPSNWIGEEEAWLDWVRRENAGDRVFYRRRRLRVKRKSGNVADFCRRWGSRYRYMIVLDADSIMTGAAIVRLVQLMEARPDAGIIQTFPVAVNRRSLFGRLQQFAGRLYGPLFAAGLHYWQLGDGQYWGHNAAIRIAPFMEYCALPTLPGKPPLGGEILSHDFVEAALMGKAGRTVWLAYDLPGSYEETSSSLLEEMGRDRRWCQGNLQHLKLVFTQGLLGAHRALFFHGAISYGSALLWFGFIILSTAEAFGQALFGPSYFPSGRTLFPRWPIWRPDWALSLAVVTGVILFLPKLLAGALAVARRTAESFGGIVRLVAGLLLEVVLSALLAPIRMMFHARFVASTFLGHTVSWGTQRREDSETRWEEALRNHGVDTVVATAWGLGAYALDPIYFWWTTPIVGALIVSVPISVLASRIRLGDLARAGGIFLTAEEISPPRELEELREELERIHAAGGGQGPAARRDGFLRAVVDPYTHAVHCLLLGKPRRLPAAIRAGKDKLCRRALLEGPGALSPAERTTLLYDREAMEALHRDVWCLGSAGVGG